jgi:PAS domain S-box-containing protein
LEKKGWAMAAAKRPTKMDTRGPSNSLLKAIFDAAPAGIVVVKGRVFCDFNDQVCRITGYSREELLGKSTRMLYWTAQDFEAVGRWVAHSDAESRLKGYQTQLRRKDGTICHVYFQVSPLNARNPDASFVATILDVTERIRTQQELAIAAERMAILLELNQMSNATMAEVVDFALENGVKLTQSSIGFIAFVNDDNTELSMYAWSKRAAAQCAVDNPRKVYRISEAGIWAEPLRQRRPLIMNDFSAANAGKKGIPSGHVAVNRFLGVPVLCEGRVVAVAGVGNKSDPYNLMDAQQLALIMEGMWRHMERQRKIEVLTTNETTFRKLFDAAPYPATVSRLDDGKFLAVNRAFEQTTGRKSCEILGKTAVEAELHLDPEAHKRVREVLRTGGIIDNQVLQLISPSKSPRYVLFCARPFEYGNEPAIFTATVDITPQISAERALRESQEQLTAANESLERKRVALEEVLVSVKQQQEATIRGIIGNVEKTVLPLLDTLKPRVGTSLQTVIDQIRSAIAELVAPFHNALSTKYPQLSPAQMRICQHIRRGLSCKQIAQLEGISVGTVNRHREQIRRKLGLTGKQANLFVFLQKL